MNPRVGCVVLTMGQRPTDLARGINSLLIQEGVDVNIVVVGNGWTPVDLPAGVKGLALATNQGIPAGRNAGAAEVSGEYIFFPVYSMCSISNCCDNNSSALLNCFSCTSI